ncbi:hypothetical protein Hanom_Chr06g00499491 [Helianthus anomalus]
MPGNNSHQTGPSNNNRALMVQVDDSCDLSIQLSSDDQGGQFAKTIFRCGFPLVLY